MIYLNMYPLFYQFKYHKMLTYQHLYQLLLVLLMDNSLDMLLLLILLLILFGLFNMIIGFI
jgi:hypothetical protein